MTNRDLYLRVRNLESLLEGKDARSLEEYLRALWSLAKDHGQPEIMLPLFLNWIENAFATPAPEFDSSWNKVFPDFEKDWDSYEDWHSMILFQIADLRRIKNAGQLSDKFRYFGLQSPSGESWYNFDPFTYLECAIRGVFGGYEEGEVIVLIPPQEGESGNSPVFEIKALSWGTFAKLLYFGQIYE